MPTKTLRPTGTKPAIPSATVRATITLTPTPYETPDVWTTVLIHPGDILVILPGMKDPESAGQYQAIYFDRVQKTADLAHLYSLTVDELRYYNGLGPGELIAADRWIVVPFGGDGPPPTPAPTLLVTIDLSSAITPKFGPEGEYVLHMVRRGENLPQIAARYHTTEEVLHQANEFTSLQPGNVLVVLPGRSDPTGIKSFGTLLVEDDIPVGVLASQMKVFESDLVWFNGLEDDQIVVTGQWLIYPNPEPTATRTFEPAWTATAGPAPTGTKQVGPTSTPTATLAPPTRTPHP
ncbi:MAG: LysM peptidoglycan-binding domain-containing protein [Anaerolineales bacterium]|nr:LysM peptidoglycan-binding domain-containing protein [Anaerolineales bacterium]